MVRDLGLYLFLAVLIGLAIYGVAQTAPADLAELVR